MNQAELTNDTRWPILLTTMPGQALLTKGEAEMLLHSLQVCLAELDNKERK